MNTTSADDLLVVEGVRKTFPGGVVANDHVTLRVRRGEVHALLGENGAGKSTLMKMLYGVYRPDAGTFTLDGKRVEIKSPQMARQLGIGMVFQNFMLVPALTVVENVALAVKAAGLRLNRQQIARDIEQACRKYGFQVSPQAKIWQLEMGERQKVEIIKLILSRARLLIFDEPTSVLTPAEVEGLFAIFRHLTADGLSVIIITHKLNEVLACADNITVLRRGTVVATMPRAGATEASLVQAIVGDSEMDLTLQRKPRQAEPGEVVLEVTDLFASDDRKGRGVRKVNLTVRAGEILGVAGISGNGQKELGEVVMGYRAASGGTVRIRGQAVTNWSAAQARKAGMACITEDPITMAAVPSMTVAENLLLGERRSRPGWRAPDFAAARSRAAWLAEKFRLSMPRLDVKISTLSGGNLQRLVIARELAEQPDVLFAYYPSRGLDIAATRIVQQVLLDCRDRGAAIVLISEDLDELFVLSDRVAVMYHGEVAGIVDPQQSSIAEVGALMTRGGHTPAVMQPTGRVVEDLAWLPG